MVGIVNLCCCGQDVIATRSWPLRHEPKLKVRFPRTPLQESATYHMGAVWSAKWARRRPSFAGQKSVAAKYAPFARARSDFAPPTARNRCVAAPASPLYTHIRHKARFPGHAFQGTHSRARIPGARFAPGPTKANQPQSVQTSSPPRSARPPFRPFATAAPPRVGDAAFAVFRRLSTTLARRGTASCIDLDRRVFASEHAFIACIAKIYIMLQYYLSGD
jgi:hypothetical protein